MRAHHLPENLRDLDAVYPCREFMPAKVNVLIEFLAELYGTEPYWDKDMDPAGLGMDKGAAKAKSRGATKGHKMVAAR